MNSARSIYYRDLKNNFWKGSEKDFVKSYYDALSYIDSDLSQQGVVREGARRREAMSAIKTSLNSMNPI